MIKQNCNKCKIVRTNQVLHREAKVWSERETLFQTFFTLRRFGKNGQCSLKKKFSYGPSFHQAIFN
jgi:hypothetical protein